MDATAHLQNYQGNCHCGTFRFSVKIPTLIDVSRCNCRSCTKNGFLWIPHVAENDLSIQKGEKDLTKYKFGENAMDYLFCPTCGSSVMARRSKRDERKGVFVNARMICDIDLESLKVREAACPDAEAQSTQPRFPEMDAVEDGLQVYHGSCHCGAVTYAVKTKPLIDRKVTCCNCSLCSRNGELWIYPSKSAVVLHGGGRLTDYAFLTDDSLHSFCGICGVSTLVRVMDEKEDVTPLNVRTMEEVDINRLELARYDGKSNGPKYEARY